MKKLISLTMLAAAVVLSTVSYGQDAKAKAVLDKVSSKVKSLKSLKANFALTINDAKGKAKDTKKGTFLMKGSKYRVNMGGQEIICDAKTVWTYLKDNKEVQVSTFNPAEQTISPSKLFSGSFEKEYTYKYGGEKTVAGKKVDVVELVPKNKAKGFNKVELYVDKTGGMISGGNVYEKSGNYYSYSISGVSTNAAIADSEFAFDSKKNPGVEVIDLR